MSSYLSHSVFWFTYFPALSAFHRPFWIQRNNASAQSSHWKSILDLILQMFCWGFFFPIVKLRRVESLKAYEPFYSLSTNCFHCTRPFLLVFDFFLFVWVLFVCLFLNPSVLTCWDSTECLWGFSIRMCRWCADDRTNFTPKAWSEKFHQTLSADMHQKDLSYSEV